MGLKSSTKELLDKLNVPTKPKKPLTPYLRFANERRLDLSKRYPNMKATEIVKKCAEDWKNVDESVKQKYVNEYNVENEKYGAIMESYQARLTSEQKEALKIATREKTEERKKRRLKKEFKETGKPKRPLTSYMRYVIDKTKGDSRPIKDVAADLKSGWASLSAQEKERYHNEYLQDKKRYEMEMKNYENRMLNQGREHLVRNKSLLDKGQPSRLSQSKKHE